VRLFQGRFDLETTFSDEPCAIARRWEAQGARWLHVVDLDGAKEGLPRHFDLVAQMVRAVSIPIQLGGGLRSARTIAHALRLGVARAVIGPAAIEEEDAGALFERFGERLVVSVDAREGRVAARGWQELTDFSVAEFAREMEALGARRLIFTDISRDGALTGPNLEGIRGLVEAIGIPVIAAGGVASLEDVRRLADTGVEGVIVGRALYVGAVSLREAIAAC
jgi:phosphoribosylformimino-5-aminoimidazole carboxamide ribotide isomerase